MEMHVHKSYFTKPNFTPQYYYDNHNLVTQTSIELHPSQVVIGLKLASWGPLGFEPFEHLDDNNFCKYIYVHLNQSQRNRSSIIWYNFKNKVNSLVKKRVMTFKAPFKTWHQW